MSSRKVSNKRPLWPTDYYSLPRSFGFAISGIVHALLHERNLRIDFAAAAYVWYFSRYYSLSRAECALLVLMMGFVIACELINTAIENTVDLETPVYKSLAKIAKDVAAGAVLVAATACIAAGFFLFWDLRILALIRQDVLAALPLWLFFAALAGLWVWLPFQRPKKRPTLPTDGRKK